MGARFESDEERLAAGAFAGGFECVDFGVGPAAALMPAFAQQIEVVIDDDRADGRVRFDGSDSQRSELQRAAHDGLGIGEAGHQE
jgi:hypothetical protein